jgi:hypothetical protein
MEPKENLEAATRAREIISELHEIFTENGWPIACIAITDSGKGKLTVIGTNQIDMSAQIEILMSAGKQGSSLINAAKAIDSAEPDITPESLKTILCNLARTLASETTQAASSEASE